jgi:hypothetical protein
LTPTISDRLTKAMPCVIMICEGAFLRIECLP